MNNMQKQLDRSNGIILRISDYKENAVLITMLVDGVGQLRLIGKGQLKTTSKLAPICQPFNELLISYYRNPNSSLGQLVNATVLNSRVELSFNLYQSIYASILCELIEKITFEDEHDVEVLYPYLNDSLDSLFSESIYDAMSFALIKLMDILGYGISLETDISLLDKDALYYLDIENGLIQSKLETNYKLSYQQVLTLIALMHQKRYDALSLHDFDAVDATTVSAFLDYIRYHLGFSLKSVQLLHAI